MTPQHLDALQLANQTRLARAAIRNRITEARGVGHERRTAEMRAAAMATAATELEKRPDALKKMAVFDFLRWSCKPLEARGIMRCADVQNELRPLGELTDRQVQVVCDELRLGPWGLPVTRRAAA